MTYEELEKAGALDLYYAVSHRLWEEHPSVIGSMDDPIEPYQSADEVYDDIRELWRPGMTEDQWYAAVLADLEL